MHATKKSVTTPAARHISLCTCSDRPPPNLVGFKVLLGYPSGTCSLFVWHQHLPCLKVFCCQQRIHAETSLPSADPRRKTGNSAYLLQLVLSDNYRHVEQELLFFLGIARFDERIAHVMVNPWSFESLRRSARHTQVYFFSGALAPRLANAPFVESRKGLLDLSLSLSLFVCVCFFFLISSLVVFVACSVGFMLFCFGCWWYLVVIVLFDFIILWVCVFLLEHFWLFLVSLCCSLHVVISFTRSWNPGVVCVCLFLLGGSCCCSWFGFFLVQTRVVHIEGELVDCPHCTPLKEKVC